MILNAVWGPPGQRSQVRRGELILGGDFPDVN
jgi:hypothetical protein